MDYTEDEVRRALVSRGKPVLHQRKFGLWCACASQHILDAAEAVIRNEQVKRRDHDRFAEVREAGIAAPELDTERGRRAVYVMFSGKYDGLSAPILRDLIDSNRPLDGFSASEASPTEETS